MKKLAISVALGLGIISANVMAEVKEFTIFHTNDIESVYDPVDAFWLEDIEQIGGMAHLSALINEERNKVDTSFLFDAGDIFTGSLSKATLGALPFDIYAAMGYDTIALGNHEFEYGWEALLDVMYRANFPTLCANIYYKDTDINFARPFTIIERDGVRVGVVGVMGVSAFKSAVMPSHVEELEIRDSIEVAQKYVDLIRDDVDVMVVLTHQNNTAPMQTDKEVDPEVQRGYDEDWKMAGAMTGVDLIIGGHSDNGLIEPVQHPDTDTWVAMTFGQGMHLGKINAQFDTGKKEFTLLEGKLIHVDSANITPNQHVADVIDKARSQFPEFSEVVGSIDSTAYRRYYRESNIGNLITDIMRERTGADIAVHNSGSIRYDVGAGDVSFGRLMDVLPFKSKLSTVELTGKEVQELLEYSYELNRGFAQMSGIETVYDSRKPVNSRLISATVNGVELNESQVYKVAATSFITAGGDGYTVLKNGQNKQVDDALINEVVIDYFKNNDSVNVPSVGRQIDVARN
ncbi:bifunctional metallophosphatase/5'-nucleotidase [Thaumasiovibrio sp. DFM-14]|uniref:bifunctional metallophosphatase/5'-nucleotidase n=1 Tax=Thaumasiovibrio sp. DFM-14 TaxID=3384792 RepID=UPI0039A1AA73